MKKYYYLQSFSGINEALGFQELEMPFEKAINELEINWIGNEMKKDEAIQLLTELISKGKALYPEEPYSENHTRWIFISLEALEEIFGKSSRIFKSFNSMNYTFTGQFVATAEQYEHISSIKDAEAFRKGLDSAIGILKAGIDLINQKGIENVHRPDESNEIFKILSLIDNKLRKIIRNKPKGENEINDMLESLFTVAGLKYSREKTRISYSSKTYVPDFVFEDLKTVVEGKFCDSKKRKKDIISEINDDIQAYRTKYPNIIFVVYDLGIIRDQDQFKEGIESKDQVMIRIVKH